jgi:hypothetical protein
MTFTLGCSAAKNNIPWWADSVGGSREEFLSRLEGEVRMALRDVAVRIALTDEFIPGYAVAIHKVDRSSVVAEVLERLAKEFKHDSSD